MGGKTRMTSRIAVSTDTLKRIREIGRGLGTDSNDETIRFLIDRNISGSETDIIAAVNLRGDFETWKAKQPKQPK
jgi:hypothetical protein